LCCLCRRWHRGDRAATSIVFDDANLLLLFTLANGAAQLDDVLGIRLRRFDLRTGIVPLLATDGCWTQRNYRQEVRRT
jgi:hypothetical protein